LFLYCEKLADEVENWNNAYLTGFLHTSLDLGVLLEVLLLLQRVLRWKP
jgi:hypothetical protein